MSTSDNIKVDFTGTKFKTTLQQCYEVLSLSFCACVLPLAKNHAIVVKWKIQFAVFAVNEEAGSYLNQVFYVHKTVQVFHDFGILSHLCLAFFGVVFFFQIKCK